MIESENDIQKGGLLRTTLDLNGSQQVFGSQVYSRKEPDDNQDYVDKGYGYIHHNTDYDDNIIKSKPIELSELNSKLQEIGKNFLFFTRENLNSINTDDLKKLKTKGHFCKIKLLSKKNEEDKTPEVLKVPRSYQLKNKESRKSLIKDLAYEIHHLNKINHPSIIQITKVYFNNKGQFVGFGMEYMKEGSLKNYKLPLTWETILKIATDVAAGLACLHKNNILHRDLKPANILLTTDKNNNIIAKIGDFGCARNGRDTTRENKPICLADTNDQLRGDRAYFPREALSYGQYTKEVDVFCLGGILYFLLTGKNVHPHQSPITTELALQKLDKTIKNYQNPPKIPENHQYAKMPVFQEFVELMNHCLNKDYDKRPTAQEIYNKLEELKNLNQEQEDPNEITNTTNIAFKN